MSKLQEWLESYLESFKEVVLNLEDHEFLG